jgi:hypothetical protein
LTYVRPGKFVRSTEIAVPCNIYAGTRLIGSRTTKAVIEWFVAYELNTSSHLYSPDRSISVASARGRFFTSRRIGHCEPGVGKQHL